MVSQVYAYVQTYQIIYIKYVNFLYIEYSLIKLFLKNRIVRYITFLSLCKHYHNFSNLKQTLLLTQFYRADIGHGMAGFPAQSLSRLKSRCQ